jgi:hypothetical protein
MFELSEAAEAALILHNAKKAVTGRGDGSWWMLDKLQWKIISSLTGTEHAFILGIITAYNLRRVA